MTFVLRCGAFLFGAAWTLLIVGLLDDTFPFFWLPVLLGLALTLVVSFQPWLRASRLGTLFCLCLAFGSAACYMASVSPVSTRFGSTLPKLERLVLFAALLAAVGMFSIRGMTAKKTASMTRWLLVPILAVCVIGYVSGGIGGGDHMANWVNGHFSLNQDLVSQGVHFFRKGIHLTAYGVLGLTLFRGAIAGSATKPTAVGFAMAMVFCIASFDELRQTTAPNRNGSPWDVCLDMLGAFLFVMVAFLTLKKGKSTRKATPLKRATPNVKRQTPVGPP